MTETNAVTEARQVAARDRQLVIGLAFVTFAAALAVRKQTRRGATPIAIDPGVNAEMRQHALGRLEIVEARRRQARVVAGADRTADRAVGIEPCLQESALELARRALHLRRRRFAFRCNSILRGEFEDRARL